MEFKKDHMDAGNDKNGHSMCCGYGHMNCQTPYGCHGRRFCFLRLILALAIAAFIFWFGVKVGELKAFYGDYGAYGYGMMYPANYGGWNQNTGTSARGSWIMGPGMMYGWYGNYQQSTTTPK